MKDNKQMNLFDALGSEEIWKREWQQMPEFVQEDAQPFQSVIIHFETKEDRDNFAQLIQQKITYKTKSLWVPKLDYDKPSAFIYTNED